MEKKLSNSATYKNGLLFVYGDYQGMEESDLVSVSFSILNADLVEMADDYTAWMPNPNIGDVMYRDDEWSCWHKFNPKTNSWD